jgi:CDP-paratose 2-epimerase
MLEAIQICQEISGNDLNYVYADENRIGDHIWYISDLSKFKSRYPSWSLKYDVNLILEEIYEKNIERWS